MCENKIIGFGGTCLCVIYRTGYYQVELHSIYLGPSYMDIV